jgi:hypothetical protein
LYNSARIIDKEEFYNLILKIENITSKEQFQEVWEELQFHGINIFYHDENTIEGAFKHRYMEVLNKYRELDKCGWKSNN